MMIESMIKLAFNNILKISAEKDSLLNNFNRWYL